MRRPALTADSRALRLGCALALLIAGAAAPPPPRAEPGPLRAITSLGDLGGPVVATPEDIYGPLYRAVELARLFPDSKTFADAVPRRPAGAILADYLAAPPRGKPALRRFVLDNFILPATPHAAAAPATAPEPLLAHIAALWPVLTREPEALPGGGSALPLPEPYVVPGGRFREIYYWDSYFTMLGLVRDHRDDLVESMIDDFTALIERYGHVPNGTRTYYVSRSQPPVFYLMLGLSHRQDPALFRRRLAALRREHRFWMRGAADLRPGQAAFNVVRLPDGALLNRYWDARATPRDESFAEDVATAAAAHRPPEPLYRDLRAAAESGWDFSSRWFADGRSLATIHTTDIVPVDLNSLLYGMERMIALACQRAGDDGCAKSYAAQADARAVAVRRWLWSARDNRFADLDWRTRRPTPVLSAATLFPLFAGIATPDQAKAVAGTTRRLLLAPGGLRTTARRTGQQWDAPNGWAPLQWIAVEGLRRNGEPVLAQTIATRWIGTVAARYRATGKLVEKYDVERRAGGHGGEYPLQDGFGWTNGVTRALIGDYGLPGG